MRWWLPLLIILVLVVPARSSAPPVVTLLGPPNHFYSDQQPQQLNFSVSDDQTDSLLCTLFINGTATDTRMVSGRGSFNPLLDEGVYTWWIACQDSDPQTAQSESRELTIDLDPPAFSSSSTPSSIGAGLPIPVATNWIENNPSKIRLTRDGTFIREMDMANTTPVFYYPTDPSQAQSTLSFTVEAIDRVQHRTTSPPMQVLLLDVTPPSMSGVGPPNPTSTNNRAVQFAVNAHDNVFPETTCSLWLDGVINATMRSALSFVFPLILVEGTHSWRMSCADDAGNSNSTEDRALTIDLTPPLQATLNGPDHANAGDNVTFTATWNEPIKNATLLRDGTAVSIKSINSTTTSLTYRSTTGEGQRTYSFRIAGRDYAGNENISTDVNVSFLDGSKPVVTPLSPPDNSYQGGSLTTFSFSSSDNLDTSLNCSLFINGILNRSAFVPVGVSQFSGVPLPQGNIGWFVSCQDASGNRPNPVTTWTVIVDTTAPTGQDASDPFQGANVVIMGTASDETLLSNVSAPTPFGANLGSVSNWRFQSDSALSEGFHSIQVTIRDRAGNAFIVLANVTTDATPPQVVIDDPDEGQTVTDPVVTFHYTLHDAHTIVSANYRLNGMASQGIEAGEGAHYASFSIGFPGRQVLEVSATDEAGNNATTRREFISAAPMDFSAWTANLLQNPTIHEVHVYDHTGRDVSEETDVPLDGLFSLDIVFENATAGIGRFRGIDASWASLQVSGGDQAIRGRIRAYGTDAKEIYLFPQMERFLSTHYDATITIRTSIAGKDILSINDDASSIERIGECGNSPCWTRQGEGAIVQLPHFSGAVLAQDDLPPNITVSSPPLVTPQSDGLQLIFSANEPVLCNYTFDGQRHTLPQGDFVETLAGGLPGSILRNGPHAIFIVCADTTGNERNLSHLFSVNDTIPPIITTDPGTNQSIISDDGRLRLRVTTDEIANVSLTVNSGLAQNIIDLGRDKTLTLKPEEGLIYGNNTLVLRATDMNRNLRTQQIRVELQHRPMETDNETHTNTSDGYDMLWGYINDGEQAYWAIDEPGIPITGVTISFTKAMSHPGLHIRKLSSFYPTPSGQVLWLIQLVPAAIDVSDIRSIAIDFRSGAEAALMRYSSTWRTLNTTSLGTGNYRAKSDGFGTFAIVAISRPTTPPTSPPPPPPENNSYSPPPTPPPPENNEVNPPNKLYSAITMIAIGVTVLILVGVAVLVYLRRSKVKTLMDLQDKKVHERFHHQDAKKETVLPREPLRDHELPDIEGLPSLREDAPQLAGYIAQSRAAGLDDRVIRLRLVTSGWEASQVDKAMRGK